MLFLQQKLCVCRAARSGRAALGWKIHVRRDRRKVRKNSQRLNAILIGNLNIQFLTVTKTLELQLNITISVPYVVRIIYVIELSIKANGDLSYRDLNYGFYAKTASKMSYF